MDFYEIGHTQKDVKYDICMKFVARPVQVQIAQIANTYVIIFSCDCLSKSQKKAHISSKHFISLY